MSRPIEDIVSNSTFHFAGTYLWASVREVRNPECHLMVTRDEKETTVVTAPENLADLDVIEVNPDRWRLLSIDCANPFYCVGFLSRVSAPLSAAGLDILVISTFTRDWVFVKEPEAAAAATILAGAGFQDGRG